MLINGENMLKTNVKNMRVLTLRVVLFTFNFSDV